MFGAEGCNFAAYIFASATVVAPMGALSVVASAVIAALFLRERLNVLGQLGAGLCLVGTTLIVVFAPQTTAVTRIDELAHRALNPGIRIRTTYTVYSVSTVLYSLLFSSHPYSYSYSLISKRREKLR